MLRLEIARLAAAAETRARARFIDIAVARFLEHPANAIRSEGGFRLSVAAPMHRLQQDGIHEPPDVWLILDSMFRDDLMPLGALRLRRVLSDPARSGRRKMQAARQVLGAPAVPMQG